jgi:hypothetical protein
MAGGAGMSSYFGFENWSHTDLDAEDFRSRAQWWDYCRYAREFFEDNLDFWEMEGRDDLLSDGDGYVLADPGSTYAVYLPDGGDATLQTDGSGYSLTWFDPETGEYADGGSVSGSYPYLGSAPFGGDAVALLE